MRQIFSVFMLLFFLSTVVKAQQNGQRQTHTFNLQECIAYAYEHQDSLKNSLLDISSAEYKVKETIGIGLPQLNGSARLQDYLKVPSMSFNGNTVRFGTKFQSSAGIELSQLLFDGTYLVGLQASKTFIELSQRNYNRTKTAVTIAVTKAYYQLIVSDEQIKLLDANINQLKEQLTQTTELNKQGFVEKIDIDRLSVLYNNLLTNRNNVERMLQLGKQVLKFQMGMPVEDELIVKEKISDIKLVSEQLAVNDTTAYRNRIEYNLLETSEKLNELNLKRYKSAYLPSVAAFGSTSWQFFNDKFKDIYDNAYPSTYVGLQVSIPVFDGFQRKYRIKQAQIEVQKSKNVLNSVKNGINLQIDQARTMYTNGMESLNNQQKNMDTAREVLRVSRIKYDQGVGSNIEVTQAQTSLQEAENNYIQALYNVLVSKVDLDAAYGRIK